MHPDDYTTLIEKYVNAGISVREAIDIVAMGAARATTGSGYDHSRWEELTGLLGDGDTRAQRALGVEDDEERAQRATKGKDTRPDDYLRDTHLVTLRSNLKRAMTRYRVDVGEILDLLKEVALEVQDELVIVTVEDEDEDTD